MDNCARENKNKDVISYCSYLIQCGLFTSMEISFLPVGHTHEDIDQMFSRFSWYFKCHNAFTIQDLKENIKNSYKFVKEVIHIEQVAQIKQMMRKEDWIEDIQGIII